MIRQRSVRAVVTLCAAGDAHGGDVAEGGAGRGLRGERSAQVSKDVGERSSWGLLGRSVGSESVGALFLPLCRHGCAWVPLFDALKDILRGAPYL